MGEANTIPMRINGVEGAAGQVKLSGGPDVIETWGAPAPAAHVGTHENGGTDELLATGLSGLLADDQHVIDAEALLAAWASLDERNFTNILTNGDMEEGNPPTGYTLQQGGATATFARSNAKKVFGTNSMLITTELNQWANAFQSIPTGLEGRTITLSVWVWCDAPNRARINILEQTIANFWSDYHTGGSDWELLTVTAVVTNNPAGLLIHPLMLELGAVITAYADGAMLVEGDTCPAFRSRPPSIEDLNTHAALPNEHHPQAHTLASHSTKAHGELSDAPADAHHPQSHNAASHSDIASSGAEIDAVVGAATTFVELAGGGNHQVAVNSTWENWDLSAIVPAGTKYVLVGVGTPTSLACLVGARKNGSALLRYNNISSHSANQKWTLNLLTECDGSRIIDIWHALNGWWNILGYWI